MTSQADERTVERLVKEADRVRTNYHRLVLLVAPVGTGKTNVLQDAAEHLDGRFVNLNLELSRQLLELTVEQRALRLAQILDDVLGGDDTMVFLSRTEILFDPAFQQDPLRLLRHLSRVRTVVAAWSGSVQGSFLTYAEPGHREYRRLSHEGLTLVEMPGTAAQ